MIPFRDTEPETFYPLLHAMLRSTPVTEQETLRARGVLRWAQEHVLGIVKVLDHDEKNLFKLIMEHLRDFNEVPSRRILEEMVRRQNLPEAMLSLLQDYDAAQPSITLTFDPIDSVDANTILSTRIDSWQQQKFHLAIKHASIIAGAGRASASEREPMLRGVKEARNFLLEEMFGDDFGAFDGIGGSSMAVAAAGPLMDRYYANKEADLSGSLTVHTGIPLIDNEPDQNGGAGIGGFDRQSLNLILGTTGARKSAVARTIAYYAALAGFRVLFIPLEWPYQEEHQIFAMMHAHNMRFKGAENLSIERFRKGRMTATEENLMKEELMPSLITDLGTDLAVRSTENKSWPGIRALIEAENANQALDIVVIDYIGLFELGAKTYDKVYLMHQHVREMKHMAMHYNQDRGLCFVSPVHGNRKGWEAAKLRGGEWEATEIYLYSEMEKSADTILWCSITEELQALNKMKIGFCKVRKNKPPGPQVVEVDDKSGLVGGSPVTRERHHEAYLEKPIFASPEEKAKWAAGVINRKAKPAASLGLTAEDMRRMLTGCGK
jgi:hypothetical protein